MSSDQRKDQEFCEKHQEWYVPHVVPCQGCVLEAEAHWRQCEDHNIRVMLGMPDAQAVATKTLDRRVKPYYDDGTVMIYHGDCREVLPNLNERPDLVLTDPPYVVSKVGRHDAQDTAVEGMDDAFWILPAFRAVSRVMATDSFCVSFYGWRHADDFLFAWRACGLRPVGHLVWVKSQWGLGTFVRGKHESAYLLTKGKARPARVVADVFDWKRESVKHHPTQKPVNALVPVIEAIGPKLILDPFMGAGSTLVAAQKLGCRAIGIEIDEAHCATAASRLEQQAFDFGQAA